MSRYELGPEVETFYEIECQSCRSACAVIQPERVLGRVIVNHPRDCSYPRKVKVSRRGSTPLGDPYSWEITMKNWLATVELTKRRFPHDFANAVTGTVKAAP